jgi:site-specific recombinase XerD
MLPHRISAASWNRNIAALEKLYRWGVEEEFITTTPRLGATEVA